jgi:predicted peptidase
MQARVFTAADGSALPYRLFVPADYTAEQEYPLLVFLHGAGERGDNNTAQLKHVIPRLFADPASPIRGAIVICPQCPAGQQWVNTPWAQGSYVLDNVPESAALSAAVQLIAALRTEFSVDAKRIYAMGISMGGFGTWDLLMRHTELFAAAIPVCGGADPSRAESLKNTPIRTFHGREDRSVSVNHTLEMARALENRHHFDFECTIYEGVGHNSWEQAFSPELLAWLLSKRK